MKKLLAITLLPIGLYSCGHKCSQPLVNTVRIAPDSAITYYYADIVAFNAGTNFTERVDSGEADIHNSNFPVSFQPGRDYKMTFHPGNHVHTFQYISWGTEKTSASQGKESDECSTSMIYKVDDSTIHRPTMNYYNGGGPAITITIKD